MIRIFFQIIIINMLYVSTSFAIGGRHSFSFKQYDMDELAVELTTGFYSGSTDVPYDKVTHQASGQWMGFKYYYGMTDFISLYLGYQEEIQKQFKSDSGKVSFIGPSEISFGLNYRGDGLIYGMNVQPGMSERKIDYIGNDIEISNREGRSVLTPHVGFDQIVGNFIVGAVYTSQLPLSKRIEQKKDGTISSFTLKGGDTTSYKFFAEYQWHKQIGLEIEMIDFSVSKIQETNAIFEESYSHLISRIYIRYINNFSTEVVPYLELGSSRTSHSQAIYHPINLGITWTTLM